MTGGTLVTFASFEVFNLKACVQYKVREFDIGAGQFEYLGI